jgi:hypothetical protein
MLHWLLVIPPDTVNISVQCTFNPHYNLLLIFRFYLTMRVYRASIILHGCTASKSNFRIKFLKYINILFFFFLIFHIGQSAGEKKIEFKRRL